MPLTERSPPGGWRAAGLALSFVATGFLFTVVFFWAGALLLGLSPDFPQRSLQDAARLQSASLLAGYGLATWLIGLKAARLDPELLRWRPGGARGFGRGFALGLAPAVLALGLAVPLADAAWRPDGGGVTGWGGSLVQLTGLLAPAALAEEVAFRGVALVLLARVLGRATAVVGIAVLFGMAHAQNPGITPLAMGNIALAGVFLGTAFYLPGGLWTATGAHLGWNLTLAALAAPVSGLPLPVAGLDYEPGGPDWLTGGSFGPEGGLLATLVLSAATLAAARLIALGRSG